MILASLFPDRLATESGLFKRDTEHHLGVREKRTKEDTCSLPIGTKMPLPAGSMLLSVVEAISVTRSASLIAIDWNEVQWLLS
jgi:hypothetical protein